MMPLWGYFKRFGLLALVVTLLFTGCAGMDFSLRDTTKLPPILTQDELVKPYREVGRIQITREVFETEALVKADVYEWGTTALRMEAAKIGADAVIFPEVSGEKVTTGLLPSTEFRASGVAIKFKKN